MSSVQSLISSAGAMPQTAVSNGMPKTKPPKVGGADDKEVRETFDKFVGEVFFGQMIKSMRETVGKPAYFHGGQAEEIFTQQLDQVLGEQMTKSSAHELTDPMYRLFMLGRG